MTNNDNTVQHNQNPPDSSALIIQSNDSWLFGACFLIPLILGVAGTGGDVGVGGKEIFTQISCYESYFIFTSVSPHLPVTNSALMFLCSDLIYYTVHYIWKNVNNHENKVNGVTHAYYRHIRTIYRSLALWSLILWMS